MILIFVIFNCFFYLPPIIYSAYQKPIDTIDITGFASCGLTSRWFRRQFKPFLENFKEIPHGLSITYHPLSTGFETVNGSEIATCENGWLECQLNKLQCCSKKYIKEENPMRLLTTITCIQGKKKLEDAISCLPSGNLTMEIQKCSESQEGETLLTSEPYPHNDSITLPWIKINGVRVFDATNHFQNVVCSLSSAKNVKACSKK